jgi:hypothetical protein
MDSKKIAEKVLSKLVKKAEDAPFRSKGIKVNYIHSLLEKKYLDEMKKKWNLDKIDIKELDWEWEDVSIDWKASFPRSSGVLNIQLMVPDQKIFIRGGVGYIDAEDKEYDFTFGEHIEIKDVETEYDDVKIKHDISPQEIDWDGKKFTVKF